MSNTIKLHNPEIAKNSVLKNLVVESLNTEPDISSITSGRIWFDNQTQMFKAGFKSDDKIKIKPLGIDHSDDILANSEAILDEIDERKANFDLVEDHINQEHDDMVTKTSSLSNELNDEKKDRIDAMMSINDKIGDLSTLATSKTDDLVLSINEIVETDNRLIQSLDQEKTDRIQDIKKINNDFFNKNSNDEQIVKAPTTFNNNLNIQGDLVVSGKTTSIDTEILKVTDNIITLNNGIGVETTPTEDAGIEIDRGAEGITKILNWNETTDELEIMESGILTVVASKVFVTAKDLKTTNSILTINQSIGLNDDGTIKKLNDTNYLNDENDVISYTISLDQEIKKSNDLIESLQNNTGDLSTLTVDDTQTIVDAINELDKHTDNNSTDIASEITTRVNAENLIIKQIDVIESSVGLSENGEYESDSLTNYLGDALSLMHADKLLDSTIKNTNNTISQLDVRVATVESETLGKIGDLTTLTTDNVDNLVKSINEVDSLITSEKEQRISSSNEIKDLIHNEESIRKSDDDELNQRLNKINESVGLSADTYTPPSNSNYLGSSTSLFDADLNLDTSLKSYIDSLSSFNENKGSTFIGFAGYIESNDEIDSPTIELSGSNLNDVIVDIASSVNNKIYELENKYIKGEVLDSDKADTYTIAHNLNTSFIDVSVQVYDETEQIWRFDLVVIEVIDDNSVKISLASGTAEKIRYVIHGY